MIRGASLLKDTESGSSPAEVDELRAELIKQKILFEAELRRQREVSDERFDGVIRQLQSVLDDNTQLRRTLHALGDRVAILEHQQTSLNNQMKQVRAASRSQSPVAVHSNNTSAIYNQQNQSGGIVFSNNSNNSGVIVPAASSSNQQGFKRSMSNPNGVSSASHQNRQASPVPRVFLGNQQQQQVQQIHGAGHRFVKIRSSPTPTQLTPRTTATPRQPITRTASNVSNNNYNENNNSIIQQKQHQQQPTITSPAHIQFRPVLRTAAIQNHNMSNNNNNNQNNNNSHPINVSSNSIVVGSVGLGNNGVVQNTNNGNPFRSPMRQSELSQIGKLAINHPSRWR